MNRKTNKTNFMKWYFKVLKNYANFNGRARRKEYWMFALFNAIFIILAEIIDFMSGIYVAGSQYGLFYLIYVFAIILPSIAVAVRRMHDVGESGWFACIPIYNFVLAVSEGDPKENKYGPDPKEIENIATAHLRKEITIKNKNTQSVERVTIGYFEKMKKTYGESAYEIIEYHD
jgi:uncharacterized membrane protein YhaH (DUF805 family)